MINIIIMSILKMSSRVPQVFVGAAVSGWCWRQPSVKWLDLAIVIVTVIVIIVVIVVVGIIIIIVWDDAMPCNLGLSQDRDDDPAKPSLGDAGIQVSSGHSYLLVLSSLLHS